MIRRLGLLVLFVGLIGLANAFFASWVTINRDDLGISVSQSGNCVRPAIPSFWRNYRGFPDYDNELIPIILAFMQLMRRMFTAPFRASDSISSRIISAGCRKANQS